MRRLKRIIPIKRLHFTFLLLVISIALLFILASFVYSYVFSSKKLIIDASEIPADIANNAKQPVVSQHLAKVKIPILLYHYVEYVKDKGDTIRQSLDIEPNVLDAQIKTLKDAGFTFITPQDFVGILDETKSLPQKPIVLSFDDGYRDFYTDVFPILKKYQVKAVQYVVTSFLDKPNNLTIKQLKEISDSGLVEIGAHTVFHAWLKGLPLKRVKYEVEESKSYLEKLLSIKIVSFAYPYGVFDSQAINVVKEAGFTNAVTTVMGNNIKRDEMLFIPRIRPGKRTGQSLLTYLERDDYDKEQIINPIRLSIH